MPLTYTILHIHDFVRSQPNSVLEPPVYFLRFSEYVFSSFPYMHIGAFSYETMKIVF